MNVLEIELSHFMAHDKTKVALPASGVVLVTGPNGAGKSCIVEGTAFGLWGRTLRGTPPWRADEAGEVAVLTDAVLARRKTTKGGKASLAWAVGKDTTEFPTLTKAQEALESIIGSFDIWRRTHVFSSADAAHFTLATDGERKRLLESILGLEKFDAALEACRDDARKADERVRTTEGLLARHQERAQGAVQRLEDARRALASLPAFEPDVGQPGLPGGPSQGDFPARLARLRELQQAARQDIAYLQKVGSEQSRIAAEANAEARQLEQGLARLKASECPTCGQTIPERVREDYREDIEKAQQRASAADAAATQERRAAEAQIVDLSGELEDLLAQQRTLEVEQRLAAERAHAADKARAERARLVQAHDEAQKHIERCEEALEKDRAEVSRLETLLAGSRKEAEELRSVEAVLGLKGVRAHVLGRALGGLERCANAWLARIAGSGLALKLRPYSEKKTGGISDAISLDVLGAGGGFGYKASSGGERRRIDVALLLALAEVAQAAHGQSGGTLFFDEVFDALDRDGIAAVSEALGELARDRSVVVISHSPTLAESVPITLWLRLEDGRVQ